MADDSTSTPTDTRAKSLALLRRLERRQGQDRTVLSQEEWEELRDLLTSIACTRTWQVPGIPLGDLEQETAPLGGINSPRMASIEKLVTNAASCDLPVLISGESGTGKELVAKEIHRRSLRSGKPFFSENCAALTETLLESELFGHVRGSFTGAERDRKGILELAHTGTLFLDEVGDMSLAMQSKLLRVLQEGEVRSVGSRHIRRIDIRFISATNRNLQLLVEQGAFRLDLFYRLNVIGISLPPLRDRREDIPHLVAHFLTAYAKRARIAMKHFDDHAMDLLCAYEWPGNIRELENTVHRCIVLSEGSLILTKDLPDRVRRVDGLFDASTRTSRPKTGEQLLIERALQDSGGDKAKAARYIGWSRPKLYRKLREYGIAFNFGRPSRTQDRNL